MRDILNTRSRVDKSAGIYLVIGLSNLHGKDVLVVLLLLLLLWTSYALFSGSQSLGAQSKPAWLQGRKGGRGADMHECMRVRGREGGREGWVERGRGKESGREGKREGERGRGKERREGGREGKREAGMEGGICEKEMRKRAPVHSPTPQAMVRNG
jgi:hypothetical protein